MAEDSKSHVISMGSSSGGETPGEATRGFGQFDGQFENRAERGDLGVYLTWEDLYVIVPMKKGRSRTILAGLTGFARPAQVLAIMGPSGCGKTTLLNALAGRLTSNMNQSGQILINGRSETLAYGTSAYVTQDDVLMTTLTVKEALYYSAELFLPDSIPKAQKKERAEALILEMGLQDVMSLRIGGRNNKGISGGQRRRVSICMEMLTRPKLLFLDEPTSGLDSAASYHVMSRIVDQAQMHGGTIIISIHQPNYEVFELFHTLCLMSSGINLYFGPSLGASEFFAANGFPCPQTRNPSDHFLRTINKDFDMEISHSRHYVSKIDTSKVIDTLKEAYISSIIYLDMKKQVDQIRDMSGSRAKKERQAGFVTQCFVLTKRSFVNMSRDPGYYLLRLVIFIALCISIGTIFYDIGLDYGSIQERGSLLMFVAGYLTFMSIGGFPSFVEELKIFRREIMNGHYNTTAFIIANMLSSAPFLLVISIIPTAMAYYLAGLQRGFGHFFFFSLVIYASMLLVEGLMMIVASIVPNFLMGIITGAGIQGMMVLSSGFFRLPNEMPKIFWKYPAYYIAFHKYVRQGLFKNEFLGLTFYVNADKNLSGVDAVREFWQMEVGYSKWVDLFILLGMVLFYRILFWALANRVDNVKPVIKNVDRKNSIELSSQVSTVTF